MPNKKNLKTPKQAVKIAIEGNVAGNIIIGSENKVNQSTRRINLPGKWFIFATLFLVLLAILAFVGRKFILSPQTGPLPASLIAATSTSLAPGMWNLELFDNTNLNGSPLYVFTLPAETNTQGGYQINLSPQDLHQQMSAMPANNYSLRLVGLFEFQEGYFEFHCQHHDGCRVFVDGHNWIDAWWDSEGGHDMAGDIAAGKHAVVIEFYDKSGYGLLEVRWRIKP